jgi:hypothetical protein
MDDIWIWNGYIMNIVMLRFDRICGRKIISSLRRRKTDEKRGWARLRCVFVLPMSLDALLVFTHADTCLRLVG